MGASNSVISISEIQGNSEIINYFGTLENYQIPDSSYLEHSARYPTIREVLISLAKLDIKIKGEHKSTLKENNQEIVVHSFDIKNNETEYCEDLTLRYLKRHNDNTPVLSISGIKTDYRILIKIAIELSKHCGSFFVVNPYQCFFIHKEANYDMILRLIKEKSG